MYSRITQPKDLVFQETLFNGTTKGTAVAGPGWEELTEVGFGSKLLEKACGAEVARASAQHESCLRGLLAPPTWGTVG